VGKWSFTLKTITSNLIFNVEKEKLTIFNNILKHLFIWNTSLHKSEAQNRKEKKKRADNEGRGLQTLFQAGMRRKQHNVEIYTKDANFDEGESVGGNREKESRYGNKMEAKRKTTSGACTNTMDMDINLEPGPGGADKNVESKHQVDSATEIPKTSSK